MNGQFFSLAPVVPPNGGGGGERLSFKARAWIVLPLVLFLIIAAIFITWWHQRKSELHSALTVSAAQHMLRDALEMHERSRRESVKSVQPEFVIQAYHLSGCALTCFYNAIDILVQQPPSHRHFLLEGRWSVSTDAATKETGGKTSGGSHIFAELDDDPLREASVRLSALSTRMPPQQVIDRLNRVTRINLNTVHESLWEQYRSLHNQVIDLAYGGVVVEEEVVVKDAPEALVPRPSPKTTRASTPKPVGRQLFDDPRTLASEDDDYDDVGDGGGVGDDDSYMSYTDGDDEGDDGDSFL